MKFLTEEDLNKCIQIHDYDIRKTGNARWIDQKCTPDVLCIIADCIFEYYHIARNYGTRSLNIDSNSVFYFGIRRK